MPGPSSTAEVLDLINETSRDSKKRRDLIDKALELAQDPDDLDKIFGFFQDNPGCFEYRNVLRKVFDKADQFKMPTLY